MTPAITEKRTTHTANTAAIADAASAATALAATVTAAETAEAVDTAAPATKAPSLATEAGEDYRDNLALLAAYRAGDTEAGERLFLLNRPLIHHVVERFRSRGADVEELVECGTVGLVKAMNTFDLSRGVQFSTYAVPLILGEIRRFLRDDGLIKVSREEKALCRRLAEENARRAALGLDTSLRAVAEAVGVRAEDAACALGSAVPVRSIDEPAYDDSLPLGATLCDEDEQQRTHDALALRLAIEELPPLWRKLILLRYFRDLSQTDTAAALGWTQVKVSREEKKVLATLRTKLG